MESLLNNIRAIQNSLPNRKYDIPFIAMVEEVEELSAEISIRKKTKKREPSIDGISGEAIDVIVCALDLILMEEPEITSEEIIKRMSIKVEKWKRNTKN